MTLGCILVDHFEEIKAAVARSCEGTEAVWWSKVEEGGVQRDGVALFWDGRIFKLVGEAQCYRLGPNMSQIAVIAVYEHATLGKKFLMAATHLKAKEGFETTRETQATSLCEHLRKLRAQHHDVSSVIVLGDFNDTPDSLCALAMRAHGFRSAYPHPVGAFTTSKWRKSVVTRVIDYIWHSAELSPASIMEMPDLKLVEPTHLPIPDWPSDHLLIGAVLSYQTAPTFVDVLTV